MGSVVPIPITFFAALNAAVFSDRSFCYIPRGCTADGAEHLFPDQCGRDGPVFERTLIVADEGAYVSYMEFLHGSDADENQLHAAVVGSS